MPVKIVASRHYANVLNMWRMRNQYFTPFHFLKTECKFEYFRSSTSNQALIRLLVENLPKKYLCRQYALWHLMEVFNTNGSFSKFEFLLHILVSILENLEPLDSGVRPVLHDLCGELSFFFDVQHVITSLCLVRMAGVFSIFYSSSILNDRSLRGIARVTHNTYSMRSTLAFLRIWQKQDSHFREHFLLWEAPAKVLIVKIICEKS